MSLADHKFGDIYLGEKRRFMSNIDGNETGGVPPDDCTQELNELFLLCKSTALNSRKTGREEFSVRFQEIVYRVSPLESLSETSYVLRRFPSSVPDIATLKIHSSLVALMMRPNLAGLVILSGAYGQGKTTTASAMTAARLRQFGGVAVTIEDPPEMPLEGAHGNGQCFQTWVNKGGFGDACRKSARWAPNIIYMGEVRDSEAAVEALRASINGRLVIATTHADSIASTVARMYQLATGASQGDDAAAMLADGLTGIFHQELITQADGTRHPQVSFLWLGAGAFSKGCRANIRLRKFSHLETEVQHQSNRMKMGRPIGDEDE